MTTTHTMRAPGTRTSFYLWIAVAMSVTAFAGFSFTYFEPLFRGEYPRVSPLVHVHGWTFFAWYLLLPAHAVAGFERLFRRYGRRRS